ncbi:hypothetical protein FB479_11663 [Brevibacillus sp. AG162]|uniref:hypothetical protein n=1 Tax=Brevibacillus sp. AG162 TaxID=2572910 RepID=UPI00114FF1D3|nr:hypothetical protein [Brevibacillus sp. AG162]TQK41962.1 hypothetical protein FB479_11663 [Brevibacillus sp. AG162]
MGALYRRYRMSQAAKKARPISEEQAQGPESKGDENDQSNKQRLGQEEYEAMMKSKVTVMAALRKFDVSFSDRTGSEELKKLLETTLAEKGLLPEVKQNDGQ